MLIAQLSDFHVTPPGTLYQDLIPSTKMAREAVAHLNALDPQPDVVLFTGDLVECGSPAAYDEALSVLSEIKAPILVQPGNHDNRENFRAAFDGCGYLPTTGPLNYCVDDFDVRFIGLDSTVPDEHHGAIGQDSLIWLDDTLAQNPKKQTIILTHHHPMLSGIPYIDEHLNRDGNELAKVLSKHDNIACVVFGHVHRFMVASFAGTLAVCCPSTASQIALRLEKTAPPASFMEPPAMLLHDVRPDRPALTHLVPIGEFGPPMDFF